MIKPDDLRATLVAALPELARDPDKLSLFVESGKIVARGTPPTAFEYRYRLTILLLDMTTHTDAVMLPLLFWIARNQPELIADSRAENIAFDAAFVDGTAVDLSIGLDLTEVVTAVRRADGGYDLTHWQEPDALALLDAPLVDDAPARLATLYVDGEAQAVIPLPIV